MQRQKKLSDLVKEVRNGDTESVSELVERLAPIINRYSRKLGYDDAKHELVEHVVKAAKNYKPNSSWGKDEIEKYYTDKKRSRGL